MGLLVVNQGKVAMMQALFDKGCTLRLYRGITVPERGDTEASYTEADFPGYFPKNLVAEQWIFTEGDPTNARYASQEFAANDDLGEDQIIGGYYVTQVATNKLLWVEPFDIPLTVRFAGQGCLVEANFQLHELE